VSGGKSVVHVHHRGDRGVDGILRLIELAGHDGPIEAMLTAMCGQIASITGVDVVSVYAREWDNTRLVMRGNHGFSPAAIGTVSLGIGEGLTGLVAECLRPVSASQAAAEVAYKHVPGLGEENYPVYVGVPLIAGGGAIGVLVLQRRRGALSADEVTLATALGAPVTLALERRRSTAIRSARLTGVTHVGGAVLGRATVVPTATAFDTVARDHGDDHARAIDRAFARLRDDLGRAMKRLAHAPEPAIGAALDRLALALCDARLRGQLIAAADRPSSLRVVARDYARAPHRLGVVGPHRPASELGAPRPTELEELCALIGDVRALKPGSIWIADRIDAFVALIAVARGAAAMIASDAISATAIAIARASRIPTVSDVSGLFGWARPDDLLAVDGDSGGVLIHPAPSDIERLRQR